MIITLRKVFDLKIKLNILHVRRIKDITKY